MTIGTTGPDVLNGGSGDDLLQGLSGDDILIDRSGGNDTLVGGDGNDDLEDWWYVQGNANLLSGGAGDDTLESSGADDTLDGGDGDDKIYDRAARSTIYAGAGNDLVLSGSLSTGPRFVDGGDGNDTLSSDHGTSTLFGGAGNDSITVKGQDNLVVGGTGADTIDLTPTEFFGPAGTAVIYLGEMPAGSDPAAADNDVDILRVSRAATDQGLPIAQVYGFRAGAGGDILAIDKLLPTDVQPFLGGYVRLVQRGADTLLQANPVTTWYDIVLLRNVVATALTADNFTPGVSPTGTAPDRVVEGTGGNDVIGGSALPTSGLRAGEGNDRLAGLAGDDTIDGGWGGNDTLVGGPGADLLRGQSGNDILFGDDSIASASDGNDTLVGDSGNDWLGGGGGNDVLEGGIGNDTLLGDGGNDSVNGRDGDDVVEGGDGNDTLDGGIGIDTVRGGGGNDYVFASGSGSLLFGGDGDDVIDSSGNTTQEGGAGNDRLTSYGYGGRLSGGDGNDWIQDSGGALVIDGGAGNDTLRASTQTVALIGGAGDDEIVLGGGPAVVIAGTGADRVVASLDYFRSDASKVYLGDAPDPLTGAATADGQQDSIVLDARPQADRSMAVQVYGFKTGVDGDLLDLSRVIADVPKGTNPFTSGQMRFDLVGNDAVLGWRTPELWGVVSYRALAVFKDLDAASFVAANTDQLWTPVFNHATDARTVFDGTPKQGTALHVSLQGTDLDGMPDPASVQYQWAAAGVDIVGATSDTFTPTQANVGSSLSVRATWRDGNGNPENAISEFMRVANTNDAPAGKVTVSLAGNVLSATSSVTDLDGISQWTVMRWQWTADGIDLPGQTASTLAFNPLFAGRSLAVRMSYVDDGGASEAVTSAAAPALPGANLQGAVYNWKTHQLLSGVQVTASPAGGGGTVTQTTSDAGFFGFTGLGAGEWNLQPSLANQASASSLSITSADALAALRLAVGTNPNPDPDGPGPLKGLRVSPYQYLAADVNGDGKVNSADALVILRMAVSAANAPKPSWTFVRDTQDLWDEGTGTSILNARSAALPTAAPMGPEGVANFVAVLSGDVDGSWEGGYLQQVETYSPGYLALIGQRLGLPTDVWGT